MVSALAAQLAQSSSLNTNLLSEKNRHKATESYLFTGRDADQHDLETIYSLADNGLRQLLYLEPGLNRCRRILFSESSKTFDRTLQTVEQNARLDESIGLCLRLLGPHLMEAPAGKLIEWLVRRFRIHEFNVEDILTLFLPYHETPHFAKMVTLLHIQPNSTWSFLLAYKSAAKNVPRFPLVSEMLRNTTVARFIANLQLNAIKDGCSHRVLTAFNAATLHDFLTRSESLDAGTAAYMLPACLEPLKSESEAVGANELLGSFILLTTLCQKTRLSADALKTIVSALTASANRVSTKQYLSAVVVICEAQDAVDSFSSSTVKALLRLPDINTEIAPVMLWVGAENFICPLIPGLCSRISHTSSTTFLKTIVTSPHTPVVVLKRLSANLLNQATSSEKSDVDSQPIRELLSVLHQRHASILKKAVLDVAADDEEKKAELERLVLSATLIPAGSNSAALPSDFKYNDTIVSSSSFDAQIRTVAVQQLVSALSTELSEAQKEAIYSSLLVRTIDTEVSVIEELYRTPSAVLPIFSAHPDAYLTHLTTVLCGAEAKPKRALVKAHLSFLTTHFCPGVASSTTAADAMAVDDTQAPTSALLARAFHGVVFPFLLYSKPKQHTAEAVWELLAESSAEGLREYEWLSGCIDTWAYEKEQHKADSDAIEFMASMNTALSSKIAESILKSNVFLEHLDLLVAHLRNPNAHVRALGYLITRALLNQLSGEHQIQAAFKVMQAMDLKQLGGMDESLGTEAAEEMFNDENVGKAVVAKPSGRSTSRLLLLSVLAQLSAVARPIGVTLNWFATSPDTRGARYVGLLRSIYTTVNTSFPSTLTTLILTTLFSNLGGDALAFLCGLSVASDTDSLRAVALRHAAASLQANLLGEQALDFQTVLPAFLVALQSQDAVLRQAAFECVSLLNASAQRSFSAVYAFDSVYGDNTGDLQYLGQEDFKKYVAALIVEQDHLSSDPTFVRIFHQQHLGSLSSKRKHQEYRRSILCYICSHVACMSITEARISLLEAIAEVPDRSKAQTLVALAQDLVSVAPAELSVKYGEHSKEFTALVVAAFDTSIAPDLNTPESSLWAAFTRMAQHLLSPDALNLPQAVFLRSLERGLFVALNAERQAALCELLLDLGSKDQQTATLCKKLMLNLTLQVTLILQLITKLQPSQNAHAPPPTKRAKVAETVTDTLPAFSLLAEILAAKQLPSSVDLISRLLEALNRTLQYAPSTQSDLSYVEQLLMLAVENIANGITEVPNIAPSVIRLDVLVELVRVSRNPQTFHQALLLIASLTRLAPDSVLHNVMPVFTFMGSNVFHRDDTYSFRVVQKTIDSIVPVMASSLKQAHARGLDLYIAAKEFLHVFSDAALHIPKHRRTNFFAHLVDVLGPSDFLPPICMLLVERTATRATRAHSEDAVNALALPTSILQHYSPGLQASALKELLAESRRLAGRCVDPLNSTPTMLAGSSDEDLGAVKRRAQALINFVGRACKTSVATEGAANDLVTLLIDLATLKDVPASSSDVLADINAAARSSLSRVLASMTASDFIGAVLSMLESEDLRIQVGALDLLAERLEKISSKVRQAVSSNVISIVARIKAIIGFHSQGEACISAFKALQPIAATAQSGEESALTGLIPLILTAVRSSEIAPIAFSVLPPLVTHLGPRVIPSFRQIVVETVNYLRSDTNNAAMDTLRTLLTTIPTFWGTPEFSQVVDLYISQCSTSAHQATVMAPLLKSMAKRAPSSTLLSALSDMWPSVMQQHGATGGIVGFFDILKKSLRSANKAAISEQLRPLIKLFLDAFELVKNPKNAQTEAESGAISAFLEFVVKLNDTAFRPIFRKLYDWAITSEGLAEHAMRQITFFHIYSALLDYFKNLMTPYMSFLLPPVVEMLKNFANSTSVDEERWACLLTVLTKSLAVDEGVFWREDKLRQVAKPLVDQAAVCIRFNNADGKVLVSECLVSLTDVTTDDALLKSINLELLMQTRSEDARLRIFALTCSESIWKSNGGKLLGLAAETATFIAECVEDEHDTVIDAARKLKNAVENVAGSITA
ncbi:hypothetical protein HGRIS_006698 [Hohenbuehelia grisea]|uniref:U3 small nucleolar RNA-associated protein 10 n=1 Tax=Hohenbuehelia grisea TaxID=104357 RepID=A0ABR3JAA3_9AGAR